MSLGEKERIVAKAIKIEERTRGEREKRVRGGLRIVGPKKSRRGMMIVINFI